MGGLNKFKIGVVINCKLSTAKTASNQENNSQNKMLITRYIRLYKIIVFQYDFYQYLDIMVFMEDKMKKVKTPSKHLKAARNEYAKYSKMIDDLKQLNSDLQDDQLPSFADERLKLSEGASINQVIYLLQQCCEDLESCIDDLENEV